MEFAREWHFVTDLSTGIMSKLCETVSFDDMVFRLIDDGIETATGIADEYASQA
jgi:hypothetical protein